jgi:hypothetical protein
MSIAAIIMSCRCDTAQYSMSGGLRWQTTDRSVVRDVPAFLATTTTRLAINVVQSARSRREMYVGPWLPEPVDTSADPDSFSDKKAAHYSFELKSTFRHVSISSCVFFVRIGPIPSCYVCDAPDPATFRRSPTSVFSGTCVAHYRSRAFREINQALTR